MTDEKLSIVGIICAVVAFLVVGTLYAVYTPPWQSPDEPAHYNYVAQVAAEGCCPIIASGDYDFDYLEELKANQFPDDADITPIEYEDHQPPLYYLLGAPVYSASNGSLIAQRIWSVAFGAGAVAASYIAILILFPGRPTFALAGAVVVAFIPQNVAIMASVNNDSLAGLALTLVIIAVLRYIGLPADDLTRPHVAVLGILVGLVFLTKLTVYLPAVATVASGIYLRMRLEEKSFDWFIQQALWAGLTALLIGIIWWARNIFIYGSPDLFGLNAHDAVVSGQPTTAQLIAEQGAGLYFSSFFRTLFNSFWGQFGWMGVPMPARIYLLISIFLVIAGVGLVLLITQGRDEFSISGNQRAGLWVLGVIAVSTIINLVIYNLGFSQAQGRYLFPMLIPFAMLIISGLWGWSILLKRWLHEEVWDRLLVWLPVAAVLWLPLLSVYALFRFVVPNLG